MILAAFSSCCCYEFWLPLHPVENRKTGKHHATGVLLLLLLVQLTLQKGGFRQGNRMLLKGDSDCCCCCCAHKDTALPDGETPWPSRKICVSRGRNVPSEISYKKLAIRFSRLAAGSLLAASLLPLRLLLRLLVSAAAY